MSTRQHRQSYPFHGTAGLAGSLKGKWRVRQAVGLVMYGRCEGVLDAVHACLRAGLGRCALVCLDAQLAIHAPGCSGCHDGLARCKVIESRGFWSYLFRITATDAVSTPAVPCTITLAALAPCCAA